MHETWLPICNVDETNNLKSTCQTQTEPLHSQHEPLFHRLTLVLALDWFVFALGALGFVLGTQGFLHTNMLV